MEPIPFRLDTGATWLNLLATRGSAFGRHPEERIPTPERLADWLEAVDLVPTDGLKRAAITAEDLDLARHLRETLRPLALCAAAGEQPAPDAAHDLIAFLATADDPLTLTATPDGLTRTPPPTATAALARIARQAADHLTGPERHTLKSCPESDCRGVFTDPDNRRRWCPNPACATRGRVRAHRARKAADQP
ncbi:CGNR zinc finger domain-containing protein [Catenulispora yoronensis]|uniref:CGNR zinc finger domain-containing protein n=1 Tax=Catenulispora yoronensis TaxID=450799 RepID=A0ABN2VLT5_9ACTN